MSFPLTGGATLAAVAAKSRTYGQPGYILIAKDYATQDHIVLDWIRQAMEAGYDVGRPRDRGSTSSSNTGSGP